jgi:FlaA1/EpsC-like NDP-sugar epimerase
VPLVEKNVVEGAANNILGAVSVAQAAIATGVENLVLISTDKAVRPTNVMGASKRMAELCLQSLYASQRQPNCTRISIVRFGNVLDSSGSVIPIFRRQIQQGGPITLTHPDVCRYFMTIPEAAQLVIQAGAMAKGGEVFLLDMGAPVRIFDLAARMVELSGLSVKDRDNPDGDIEVEIIGLRPGEKLYEELLTGENPQSTLHPKIYRANEPFVQWEVMETDLTALRLLLGHGNVDAIIAMLKKHVTGYEPHSEVVDLVYAVQAAGH